MSIPTLNPTDMADLIKHVAIKLNEPVMIVGRLGSAKSAITNQVARDLNNKAALDALLGETNTFDGCVICDIRLGQYESVDLRGFPGVNKATGFTVWHAPSTMPFVGNDDFPDDKIILLFLDELTSAQPSVFAIGYQLINERRVGEQGAVDLIAGDRVRGGLAALFRRAAGAGVRFGVGVVFHRRLGDAGHGRRHGGGR